MIRSRRERSARAVLLELAGRRVRRLPCDALTLPGWCVTVKRVPNYTPADLAGWWCEAVELAQPAGLLPLLMVRRDGEPDWTCYWPSGLHHTEAPRHSAWVEDTLNGHPLTWWRTTRRLVLELWARSAA